jgi:hypothetical protein
VHTNCKGKTNKRINKNPQYFILGTFCLKRIFSLSLSFLFCFVLFFFFFGLLLGYFDVAILAIHPQVELMKFGYQLERTVDKFKNLASFHNLLEAGTYGLINMAISEKKILEIWRGWCFFFHKNPLYELHWLFFFRSPLVPGKKTKRK